MGDAPDEDPHHGRTPRDDPSKLSIRVQAELARINGEPFNGNDYSTSPEDDPDDGYLQVDATDEREILRYHRSIKDTSAANQRNHLRNLRILATNKHFDGPLTEQDHETLNDLIADLAADRGWGQGTERNYAISLGAFLRNRGHEDVADNLNVPDPERPDIDPDEVLAWDEDIVPLMDASRRTRDAALIATLWESGNRITTIASLTVGDYNQVGDTHALLSIPETEGDKDAGGHIKPLVVARAAIDRWLAGEHPCPDDDDVALFCSIRPQDPDGAHISPPAIRQLLKRIAERAETIDADRVSPHAFRHSRATYMRASDRFDSIDIEQTMAWVEGSEQHSRYENVEQEKAANRILRKQGIATEETEEADVDIECPRCNIVVPAGASYCPSCSLRLTDTGQRRPHPRPLRRRHPA